MGRRRPESRATAPGRRTTRRLTPAAERLEGRQLLATVAPDVAPTSEEQYLLALINRARANPAAEARRLRQVVRVDPAVRSQVRPAELQRALRVLAGRRPAPPLAFNTRLIAAARDQADRMAETNDQRHAPPGYLTDAQVARADDGRAHYPVEPDRRWAVGENLFAYTRHLKRIDIRSYVDYLHAGLMLDWGVPDLSHQANLMAPGPGQAGTSPSGHPPFREIGIGLRTGVQPTVPPPSSPAQEANRGLDVGPVLVAQEFGWHEGSPAAVTGVIYQDRDGDRFYSPGEGLGNVVVEARGQAGQGTFRTTTWDSGGYTLELPPGRYFVTASGPALPAGAATRVQVGLDNVAWDVRYAAPGGLGSGMASAPRRHGAGFR